MGQDDGTKRFRQRSTWTFEAGSTDMLAIFSIAPHVADGHLSPCVAKIIEEVKRSGLEYQLTAMGTLVEGEPDAVFELIRACHMLTRNEAPRISTKVWIDDQVGKTNRLRDKVCSVETLLAR
jgi:uncharacterized protein (TIGR00106 family)